MKKIIISGQEIRDRQIEDLVKRSKLLIYRATALIFSAQKTPKKFAYDGRRFNQHKINLSGPKFNEAELKGLKIYWIKSEMVKYYIL